MVVQPTLVSNRPSPCFFPVPPRIENEDREEAVKVPEGQTAHLTCNATGEGHSRWVGTSMRSQLQRGGGARGFRPAPSPSAPCGRSLYILNLVPHPCLSSHRLCLCPKHSSPLLTWLETSTSRTFHNASLADPLGPWAASTGVPQAPGLSCPSPKHLRP